MDRLQAKRPLYPLVSVVSPLVVLVVGLLTAKSPCFPAYIVAVVLLYCAFGLAKQAVMSLAVFIPVSLVFALFSFLFQRNFSAAGQMAGRVILLGVSALPMVTLPPINLTRCIAALGMPRIITLGMLIAIRFVPVVQGEVGRVREAMKTRGVRHSFYRTFAVPVMIRLINISDTMALSLETRAFSTGREPVSVYKPVVFAARDAFYSAAVFALIITWVVMA
ncbi:MAG TPA: energy-coupling factor transporter transmembrane protein EcfT [Papillibacter sp.]|jgi:energy-coupling factor transporter transmembrane protein EcfT|nr:energy-coupling factor transporter transmembrane protein EcfT [Papillibacter sp.]